MAEIQSPRLYRIFQKVALGIGVITIITGYASQNSAVGAVGLVILVHALVGTLILAVEDRRTRSSMDEQAAE